jgi:hypothetical protein
MTKISQLTNIGSALAGDDEFVVRDVSDVSTPNKKVTSSGIIDYIISQGSLLGFTQIAAGVGPLARVRTTTSGTTGTIIAETASAGTIAEAYRVTPDKYFRMAAGTLGIQFGGDTAAANALDDYEEGAWTPVVVGTSTAGTGTYSIQVGRYTKIGNTVTAHFHLAWSAHTGTGSMVISGLPVLPANVNDLYPSSSLYVNNLTTSGIPVLLVSRNEATAPIYFINNGTAGGLPMDTAASLISSIVYQSA